MPTEARSLTRLRKIVAAWPEVHEKISHGAPTFWGGKKTFCSFHESPERYGGRAIWIKSTHEAQQDLVESDPDTFFVPPHVGVSGWVAIRMSGQVNWPLVEEVLDAGYRLVAPKRAIKALDAMRNT